MRFLRFLLILLALGLPLVAAAQGGATDDEQTTEDEAEGEDNALFEQVFGKRATPQPAEIEVPLVIDEVDRSLITITTADDPDNITIDAKTLLNETRAFLLAEPQARLAGLVSNDGKLTVKNLASLRIKTTFDQGDLVLRLDIPADIRKPMDLPFSTRGQPPPAENPVGPANYSAYLNMRTGLDYVHESDTRDGEGKQPLRADLNGAFALPRLAFDYRLSYTERDARPLQRGDMRFLFDQPEHLRRFAFGDVDYPVTRFQGFVPLGGVSVARNYTLNPYVVTEPQGRSEFLLLSASRVEILVNGSRVRTLRLPAGRYNIRDLPISAGANDVILRITNDVGEVQEIAYSLFFDSDLLAQGLDRYSFTMGFPQDVEDGLYKYDTAKASFSGNYRYGLTDFLTAGGSLQGNNDQQIIGGDALWATAFGTFDSSLAVSYLEHYNADMAARLVYGRRGVQGESTAYESYDFAVQYTGLYFAQLGRTQPDNDTSWDFAARYGRRLPFNVNGSLGGTYRFGRNEALDTHTLGLSLSRPLMQGAFINFDLERRKLDDGEMENRAFISFNWSLYDSPHSFNATRDTLNRSSRLDWSYRPTPFLNNVTANGGIQRTGNANDLFGDISRTGYRSELSASHDINMPRSQADEVERVTNLRAGSALVFADGYFGMTRPVTDSFALVVPNKALKGQAVGVNPRGDNKEYQAENGRLGNAVLPDLTSYQQRRVVVDAPDLPIGVDLGKDVFDVTPTIRAGTLIRVGTEATVLLTATIFDAANTPLELAAGEISREGDASFTPILVFTNRGGVLSSEGLRPGRHLLTMFDFPDAPIAFDIPAGAAGSFDAGSLRVGARGGEGLRAPATGVPPPRPGDLAPTRRAEAAPAVAPDEPPAPPAVPLPPVAVAPAPPAPAAPPAAVAALPPASSAAPVAVEPAGSNGNLGIYRVQLAAFRDPDQVADAWKLIQARHADILGSFSAVAVEVEIPDRGTFYRLQVGPLRDATLARRICAELNNRRQSCLVITPSSRGPAAQSERSLPSLAQAPLPAPAAAPAPALAGPAAQQPVPAEPGPRIAPVPLQPANLEVPLQDGVMVQLTAARTAPAAEAEWARLQRRHGDVLGDLEGFVIEVDLGAGKGVVHRLQLGPLPDRVAAERLCATLKQRGQDCLLIPGATRAAVPAEKSVPVTPRADLLPEPDRAVVAAEVPQPVFRLQLAALRDPAAAEAEWRRLATRHAAMLGQLTPSLVAADLGPGKGMFHRLQAGPLPSAKEAESLCATLRAAGQGCQVVSAEGPITVAGATAITDRPGATAYAANR